MNCGLSRCESVLYTIVSYLVVSDGQGGRNLSVLHCEKFMPLPILQAMIAGIISSWYQIDIRLKIDIN